MVTRAFLASILVVLLLACHDGAPRITDPVSRADSVVPGGLVVEAARAAAGAASCELAVRTALGTYVTKTIKLRLPRGFLDPGASTVKVGFRTWAPGQSDPARLALCEIPSTPAAVEWLSQRVSGGQSVAGAPGGTAGEGLGTSAASSAFVVYDGDVTNLCDPGDESCECVPGSPGCGGWEEPPPEQPDLYPPPDESVPDSSESSIVGEPGVQPVDDNEDEGGGGYYVAPECWARTDMPHLSTHAPGMVNVVGVTWCNFPSPSLSVVVALQRWKCILFFCWYSTLTSNARFASGMEARTNAASVCQTGWYRGRSYHTAMFPTGGVGSAVTRDDTYIACFF